MPTLIDALCVSLNLDASKFVEGQKQSCTSLKRMRDDSTTTAKHLQAKGVEGAEFFRELEKGAAGFLSLIGAGDMAKFATGTVNNFSAMERAASAMGLKVDQVQAYANYIARTGGNAKEAAASLANLSQTMATFRATGTLSTDQLWAMQLIGGGANDSPLAIVQKFAAWAQRNRGNSGLVSREGGILGLDEGTIYAARTRGARGMTAGVAESYQLGVMSEDQVARMNEARGAFAALIQAITGNANALVASAAGAVPVINALTGLIQAFPGATKGVMAVAALVALLGSGALIGRIARLVGLLGGGGAAGGAGAAAAEGGAVVATVAKAGKFAKFGGLLEIGAMVGMGLDSNKMTGEAYKKLQPIDWRVFGGKGHIDWRSGNWIPDGAAHAAGGGHAAAGHAAAGGGGAGGTLASGGHAGAITAPAAISFFRSLGYTADQARGMAAGMFAEGPRGGPSATGKNLTSSAFGIGQWMKGDRKHPGRQVDFARLFGHDIHGSSLAEQLQFMAWELGHTERRAGGAMHGAGSASEALMDYVTKFMRPRPGAQVAGDLDRGRRFLGAWGGARAGAGSGARTTVYIQNVNVNGAKISDGRGLAQGMRKEISANGLVQQANSGLS